MAMVDKPELDRIRAKAIEIVELSVGMMPRSFLSALAVAAGSMIKKCWPSEKHSECIEGHSAGVKRVVGLDG